MLKSFLSIHLVAKDVLVNVVIVGSSRVCGSNSIPALLFADCVISICFYFKSLINPFSVCEIPVLA